MTVAVCWKWIAPGGDDRWGGVSDADRAALEVALVIAEATDDHVDVVTVGPSSAERGLRDALAVGARRAVRVDAPDALRSDAVADALAGEVHDATWVVCGDYSSDRGSGSVPAFLAAELDLEQALGLVAVDPPLPGAPGALGAIRRLDGGRRERLQLASPAVLSVEGSVARLRRASLAGELAARDAAIEVVPGPTGPVDRPDEVRPFRPRARVLPPPRGGDALARVRALTDAGAASGHGETVSLEPAAAAVRIVEALREWGYLDDDSSGADDSARHNDR